MAKIYTDDTTNELVGHNDVTGETFETTKRGLHTITGKDGIESTENSTTTPLSAGGTFSGEWIDVTNAASITSTVKSDQRSAINGLLYQFSIDGVTVDQQDSFSLIENEEQVHIIPQRAKYFRVFFTNGETDQSTFRLQVLTHKYKSAIPITTPEHAFKRTEDAQPVRPISDLDHDRNLGLMNYESKFSAKGYNYSVGSTEAPLNPDGDDVFPTAVEAVRIRSGGNAADASGSTGAQRCEITGGSGNVALQSESLATNGTASSSDSSDVYGNFDSAKIADAGTYGGKAAADIVFENSSTNQKLAVIKQGDSETFTGRVRTLQNKTGYIEDVWFHVSGNYPAHCYLNVREDARLVTGSSFSPIRRVWHVPYVTGEYRHKFKHKIAVPAKADIYLSAKSVDTNLARVSGGFSGTYRDIDRALIFSNLKSWLGDGVTDHALGPTGVDFTGAWSIFGWVKMNAVGFDVLFSQLDQNDLGNSSMYLYCNSASGEFGGILIGDGAGSSSKLYRTPTNLIFDGSWHSWGARYDGANNFSMYCDGINQDSTIIKVIDSPISDLESSTLPILLGGAYTTYPNVTQEMPGGLDEVAIFNTALTDDQFLDMHNKGVPIYLLGQDFVVDNGEHWWRLGDPDESATFVDRVGSGDVTNVGGTVVEDTP